MVLSSMAAAAESPPKSDATGPAAARPMVGAIRWDAWYGRGSPVVEVEKTLGPKKYQFRLPFFAKVLSPSAVSINGDSQATMEQEIAYAADAGLNYWAFVDYWDHANLGIALRRFRAAGDKKGLRFCLIEEGRRIDGIGTSGWPRLVACFKDPHYQTVLDNRPLLFVFGKPKVIGKKEFESLAEQTVAAGLKKPYCVFMGWNPAADAQELQNLGFDAVSAYAAGAGYGWEQWPYERLTKHVRTAYWEVCRQQRIPTITFATAGWDPRPRVEHPTPWVSVVPHPDPTPPEQQQPLVDAVTATPAQLAQHLSDSISWTKNNRDLNPANAVIIYGWNENDEGGWLIPTLKPDGQPDRSRLEAISRILRPDTAAEAKAGVPAPQVQVAPDGATPVTPAPLVTVTKQLYRQHAKPREAALASVAYVGGQLERREIQAEEVKDDVGDNVRARWSLDNGRTWTEFVAVQPSNNVNYGGVTVWEGEGAGVYHPASGVFVQTWLRQIVVGKLYHCFTYSRYSRDLGRTWSTPQQLRYEARADFDPRDPKAAAFLDHNEGYFGNNLLIRRDGTLVHVLAHCNAPGDPLNNQRPWRMGSVLFSGRWNPDRKDFDWTPGARVEIAPEHSARGLMEPEVAELADGRLLVVWRGSTQGWDGSVAKLPGRKFFSLSSDGGRTLTPPAVWKYADGSDFYSPSSIHRLIRHSVTGKLYWLGNISPTPPSGNSPRYPLVIAEVDEGRAALRKESVTTIDDRQPGQSASVQFSNFSLLEDRQTHLLELHLTTYGQEPNPADWATADNYKYFLKLP